MLLLENCDALDMIQRLKDSGVKIDGLVTDPPYSSGGAFRGDRASSTAAKYTTENVNDCPDFFGDTRDQRGFTLWVGEWLRKCTEIMKQGAVFALFIDWRQLPALTDAVQYAGLVWRGVAVWDKTEATRPQKGRFRTQAEYIVWGSWGPLSLDRPVDFLPGVFRVPVAIADKQHQTQKPLIVMDWLCRFVEPCGVVFDPFMGSGTTGVAALRSGHGFIGCELSKHYFDLSVKRIKQEAAQGVLV